MPTYNLITLVNGQTSGVEPLIADSEKAAIAYAAGMLSERVKDNETLFVSAEVSWMVDCGDRDIFDAATAAGDRVGAFHLVQAEDHVTVLWQPEVRV